MKVEIKDCVTYSIREVFDEIEENLTEGEDPIVGEFDTIVHDSIHFDSKFEELEFQVRHDEDDPRCDGVRSKSIDLAYIRDIFKTLGYCFCTWARTEEDEPILICFLG